MGARQSEKIFLNGEADDVPAAESDRPDATPRRVLSVSPDQKDRTEPANLPGGAQPAGKDEVFISPRVIDQQAFDELASSLRTLIDEASATRQGLGQLIAQARDGDQWANKASVHLQERLRLSARILKAFQLQIARVEKSIERMGQQERALESVRGSMEESLEEFEHHLDATLDRFGKRIHGMTTAALERFEQQLQQRTEQADRIDERILAAQRRVESSIETVEEVEENVLLTAHRTAENAAQIESRTADAKTAINRELSGLKQQADAETRKLTNRAGELMTRLEEYIAEVSGLLDESRGVSNHLAGEIEQAGKQTRGIRCALESKLDQCRQVEIGLQRRCQELTPLVEALRSKPRSGDAALTSGLRGQGEFEGMPESVAQVIEDLREGVGRDMSRLAGIMNDIARRIDQSGWAETLPGSTAELKPGAETTVLPLEDEVRHSTEAPGIEAPGIEAPGAETPGAEAGEISIDTSVNPTRSNRSPHVQ